MQPTEYDETIKSSSVIRSCNYSTVTPPISTPLTPYFIYLLQGNRDISPAIILSF